MKPEFWVSFCKSAGVYAVGEVYDGSIEWVSSFVKNGLPAVLNYPFYLQMKYLFIDTQSMYNIRSFY